MTRPIIDVSDLPETELDHRSAIWWANLLLLAIETTMFALLVGGYFYLRGNFTQWPPPHIAGPMAYFDPVPALLLPTINLGVLLLSVAPMVWADRGALHMQTRPVCRGLMVCIALGVVIIALRAREFSALRFRWDDNAYGSIVWTIVAMHLLHVIVATSELALMLVWILRKGMDEKHARDVRVTAVYWYWVVGVWVPLYVIVFQGPRFF
jgi:cytochrome c oxidase subunit III